MMQIDSHHHFWKFDPVRDSWITDDMKIIQADFLSGNLQPVLEQNGIYGTVLVQSDQTPEGNEFMLEQSAGNSFVKGIVAWVDLRSADIEEQLSRYRHYDIIKGFRHILQGEANRALMLESDFLNGIKILSKFDYTYDILIFKDQLKYIPEFLKHFPDQRFVLDHIAKPDIKNHNIEEWRKGIRELGTYPNLFCKVSGMFAEADWKNWKPADFLPYLDVVTEIFGPARLMYGSDWPVCLVAATYEQQLKVIKDYFSSFSENEQSAIFGKNAMKFYGLQ